MTTPNNDSPQETMKVELRANIANKKAWAAQKPTQEELDTAARVVRWLGDHATYYPEEYGADDSMPGSVAHEA